MVGVVFGNATATSTSADLKCEELKRQIFRRHAVYSSSTRRQVQLKETLRTTHYPIA